MKKDHPQQLQSLRDLKSAAETNKQRRSNLIGTCIDQDPVYNQDEVIRAAKEFYDGMRAVEKGIRNCFEAGVAPAEITLTVKQVYTQSGEESAP